MKINHSDMVGPLAKDLGLAQTQVKQTLEKYDLLVKGELAQGNDVTLLGIGTLRVVNTPAREGRNPKTGEAVQIPAGRRVKLVLAKGLKKAIRG